MTVLRPLVVVLLAVGLTGCATAGQRSTAQRSAERGAAVVEQPFRDLSLIRQTTPEILTAAAAAPYAFEPPADCKVLGDELAALDLALPRDLDAPREKGPGFAEDAALSALAGAFGLPFRGMVRKVSGAERRDRDHARAVLAGMVRRGFLKGVARTSGCLIEPTPTPTP